MLSIRTNLSSFIAQNSMRTSTDKLNQAIERMTTGSKINHAKDNAANYSISTNMSTKMSALRVAEDNALQGLEMISSTSENLSIVEDKLARMRALSTQALNGTYSAQSLNALNLEAEALLKEINRINESATYNGIKLFNTGKDDSVTNAGKELKLNEQGFLQDVVKVDTTGMTALGSMADDATLAVGEYTISSKDELVQLKEMSDAALLEPGSTFVMTKNIDMSGVIGWNGIGATNAFQGNFNGNGHTISNLTGTNGLFVSVSGAYGNEYEIKNLKLDNVKIKASVWHTGAIVDKSSWLNLLNCSVTNGEIISTSGQRHGGILGYGAHTNVDFCNFEGIVKGVDYVGGIVGFLNYAEGNKCRFIGDVSGTGNYVGGIAGGGDVSNCMAFAIVKGVKNIGGISGTRSYTGNYFSGYVQGDTFVGGISGYSDLYNDISDCIVEGTVSGNSDVGIITGNLYSGKEIKDCYYYGKLTNSLDLAGNMDTAIINNAIDITIPCDYTFQIGTTGDDATSSVAYTTYIDFTPLKELLTSGVDSAQYLAKIDELVEIVSLKQTELGTMENRLMSVLDEISTQYENLVSSHSTIKDADMAKVSSQYIQQQILQDASATLLASTQNIQAQNVLGLIQSLSNLS